jgi:hypothetical protein
MMRWYIEAMLPVDMISVGMLEACFQNDLMNYDSCLKYVFSYGLY